MLVRIIMIILFTLPSHAFAYITTYMTAWNYLPRVQISQGNNYDCSLNTLVYDRGMQNGFQQTWPGTGENGDDVCWRRTSDPLNPQSGLQQFWTRCASDSDILCEIN
jgi:hypothetical protein